MLANNGSLPPDASQRARTLSTDKLIASAGWWHVTHARPFVPIGSKNGWPCVSIAPPVFRMPVRPCSFVNDVVAGSVRPSPGAHH